jgi:hypothetical protein
MPTTFDAVAAGLKEGTVLEWIDMNYSPVSVSLCPPYWCSREALLHVISWNVVRRIQNTAKVTAAEMMWI